MVPGLERDELGIGRGGIGMMYVGDWEAVYRARGEDCGYHNEGSQNER